MSRVVNVWATPDIIKAACDKHAFRISALEALVSGGARVVMLDPRDADAFRILMKDKLIEGAVTRSASHMARQWSPPLHRK
ncbi:hypothetical protein [Sphingobium sp. Sx8-8]|uniref:hypothetical protein n=1 Tax=Sphingobium sp. Sx8-8 TaxID=2933617 RepID=UPI001F589BE6|nr:hypothetical protein [Sphingobium sp. Sx8-8]